MDYLICNWVARLSEPITDIKSALNGLVVLLPYLSLGFLVGLLSLYIAEKTGNLTRVNTSGWFTKIVCLLIWPYTTLHNLMGLGQYLVDGTRYLETPNGIDDFCEFCGNPPFYLFLMSLFGVPKLIFSLITLPILLIFTIPASIIYRRSS